MGSFKAKSDLIIAMSPQAVRTLQVLAALPLKLAEQRLQFSLANAPASAWEGARIKLDALPTALGGGGRGAASGRLGEARGAIGARKGGQLTIYMALYHCAPWPAGAPRGIPLTQISAILRRGWKSRSGHARCWFFMVYKS